MRSLGAAVLHVWAGRIRKSGQVLVEARAAQLRDSRLTSVQVSHVSAHGSAGSAYLSNVCGLSMVHRHSLS